ncbi:alkaline phosphatase family protein [Thermodesulfobacteriota bacterium]
MTDRKVLIIGLDCAPPDLVFNRWTAALPNLAGLMRRGSYGPLKSCIPAVTVPAWSCMLTGKDPGTLGCYGYRNRADYSYEKLTLATAQQITAPRVWDVLSYRGKTVLTVGVPQTYPPSPVNGIMVSGFLTPDTSCTYTYPAELQEEISAHIGEYIIDVDNFRTDDKQQLLRRIYAMTENRFSLFAHLLRTKPWDFAMLVEMGLDRIHHGFWKHMDPRHPLHEPGSAFADAIFDYYRFVDEKVGELLSLIDADTAVLVVSDHGAQAMQGGFCINEWLLEQGLLRLNRAADEIMPLGSAGVAWGKTTAWGEGGYFGRIFLNVRDREPRGTIPPERYEQVRRRLTQQLEAIPGPDGQRLGTRVFVPQDIYRETNAIPPDLIVYFDNLRWRSIGSVGHGSLYTAGNDLGPDDANHAENGIWILADPAAASEFSPRGPISRSLLDIAPTVLALYGLPVPEDMQGSPLTPSRPGAEQAYSPAEEEIIKKRLRDLGYL